MFTQLVKSCNVYPVYK